MSTVSEHSADRIELAVAAGRVRASVRLGDREKASLFAKRVLIIINLILLINFFNFYSYNLLLIFGIIWVDIEFGNNFENIFLY